MATHGTQSTQQQGQNSLGNQAGPNAPPSPTQGSWPAPPEPEVRTSLSSIMPTVSVSDLTPAPPPKGVLPWAMIVSAILVGLVALVVFISQRPSVRTQTMIQSLAARTQSQDWPPQDELKRLREFDTLSVSSSAEQTTPVAKPVPAVLPPSQPATQLVTPGFDFIAAVSALDGAERQAAGCWQRAENAGQQARLRVTFVPSGSVQEVVFEEPLKLEPKTQECVRQVFSSVHVAPYQGQETTVQKTFLIPQSKP